MIVSLKIRKIGSYTEHGECIFITLTTSVRSSPHIDIYKEMHFWYRRVKGGNYTRGWHRDCIITERDHGNMLVNF